MKINISYNRTNQSTVTPYTSKLLLSIVDN